MFGNIYVTIVVVALLMLLDYWLTLKGYVLYKKQISKYIEMEGYELNPLFGNSIERNKYNIRHGVSILMVALVIFVIHYGVENKWSPVFNNNFLYMAEGMLVSAFSFINIRHLKNISTFLVLKKKKGMLKGKVFQSSEFALRISYYDALGMFLMLLVVFAIIPSAFTLGFASGPLVILLAHFRWISKLKKARK